MTNVVKFPGKPPPLDAGAVRQLVRRNAAGRRVGNAVLGVLAGAFVLVRVVAFLILYWLRLPVTWVCQLVSVPGLLLAGVAWYLMPADKQYVAWAFAGASFAAFALLYLYDVVLMWLSPEDVMRQL